MLWEYNEEAGSGNPTAPIHVPLQAKRLHDALVRKFGLSLRIPLSEYVHFEGPLSVVMPYLKPSDIFSTMMSKHPWLLLGGSTGPESQRMLASFWKCYRLDHPSHSRFSSSTRTDWKGQSPLRCMVMVEGPKRNNRLKFSASNQWWAWTHRPHESDAAAIVKPQLSLVVVTLVTLALIASTASTTPTWRIFWCLLTHQNRTKALTICSQGCWKLHARTLAPCALRGCLGLMGSGGIRLLSGLNSIWNGWQNVGRWRALIRMLAMFEKYLAATSVMLVCQTSLSRMSTKMPCGHRRDLTLFHGQWTRLGSTSPLTLRSLQNSWGEMLSTSSAWELERTTLLLVSSCCATWNAT